jgi:glucosamine--fructose-6-phosphate aminotransferase (isomerizing)
MPAAAWAGAPLSFARAVVDYAQNRAHYSAVRHAKGASMPQPDPTPHYHTLDEILSQPDTWQSVLRRLPAHRSRVREEWAAAGRREIVFMGCGSPYFLSRSAAAFGQAITGIPARAFPASDLLFFPETVFLTREAPLLVAFSRSGTTTETVNAVERFRRNLGGPVIAIICESDTALEAAASMTVGLPEATEISMAQTRSFTSMLIAALDVAFALSGVAPSAAFQRLPDFAQAILGDGHALAKALGENLELDRLFFLGSGSHYGLACEAMLKMKEMSLTHSEAYQFLEFRHGPMSMVNDRTLIVGFVSSAALPHEVAVLAEMRARGATVLALAPDRLADGLVDHQLLLPAELNDWERGPLYLPIAQLIAYYRSVAKGLNPDLPHGLTAVVNLDLDEIEARAVRKTQS